MLVTSGTGSGKTECFLVPILDDLARQAEGESHRLEGVQAIMLYPLNALIASQEERLRAWTAPFGGKLRFALYNGLLRDREKAGTYAARPEVVPDRKILREAPPPILVTNVTMLEYMLLRPQDAPEVVRRGYAERGDPLLNVAQHNVHRLHRSTDLRRQHDRLFHRLHLVIEAVVVAVVAPIVPARVQVAGPRIALR